MLIGIDPHLSAPMLSVFRDMGHGDQICIADCNFPAGETARKAGIPVIRVNLDTVEIGRAILSVFPLDSYVPAPVDRMEIEGAPDTLNEAHSSFKAMVAEVAGERFAMGSTYRFDFYPKAAQCAAIIWTLDRRPYANFILQKGVIGADGQVI